MQYEDKAWNHIITADAEESVQVRAMYQIFMSSHPQQANFLNI